VNQNSLYQQLRSHLAYLRLGAAAEAECEAGVSPRVAPFADLRDVGALLQRAGLALPAGGPRAARSAAPPAAAAGATDM